MTSLNTSSLLWVLALRISIWSNLRENKKYGVKYGVKMFPNKDWNLDARKVQIDTTGTVDRHPISEQWSTSHCPHNCYHPPGWRSVTKPVRKAVDTQNCVLCVCGILSKHFTPYFFTFSQRQSNTYSQGQNPSLKQRIYWRHSYMYVINSKEYITNRLNIFSYLQHIFFQLFTLKFLRKLVDLTKLYKKTKGGVFSEHTVCNFPHTAILCHHPWCMGKGNWLMHCQIATDSICSAKLWTDEMLSFLWKLSYYFLVLNSLPSPQAHPQCFYLKTIFV